MAATARDTQELAKDQRARERERVVLVFGCACVCEALFRFQSSKVKKDSQPESTSTGKTHVVVVVVAIVCCCICKYAIQSDYVTKKCPNECRRRVRNAAAGAACASRLINRANSGTNLKPVYMQCCRAAVAVAAVSRHQLQSQSMLIANKIINEIVYRPPPPG